MPEQSLERSPQQARSRQTQAAILSAAEALMRDRPFDQVSVADIAAEAGVSVGNFYNRFPDKTALLLTMFRTYEQERTSFLQEQFELSNWAEMDIEARAAGVVDLFIGFFWSRRALIRSFIQYYRNDPGAASPPFRSTLKKLSEVGADILVDAMKGDRTAKAKARLGLQSILALCREFILFGDEPSKKALGLSRKALARHLTQVLLASVTDPA